MTEQPSSDTVRSELETLAGENCICIESYRKNGDGVRTPVWFVMDQDNYSSEPVERLGRSGEYGATLAYGSLRAVSVKLKGEWMDASATIGIDEEKENVLALLPKKYGLQYRLTRFVQRLFGGKGDPVVLRITI